MTDLVAECADLIKEERKDLVFLALQCELAERFEDMSRVMCKLVNCKHINLGGEEDPMSIEERNMLSLAYKNRVGPLRSAWRNLNTDELKDNQLVAVLRTRIERELEVVCREVVELGTKVLIPASSRGQGECAVFHLKMTADYHRYLAEVPRFRAQETDSARDLYEKAMTIAIAKMRPCNPIRLGLALNYSVFCYEIARDRKRACELSKEAFDCAMADLPNLEEQAYKDATLIMQLLRENLGNWAQDTPQE